MYLGQCARSGGIGVGSQLIRPVGFPLLIPPDLVYRSTSPCRVLGNCEEQRHSEEMYGVIAKKCEVPVLLNVHVLVIRICLSSDILPPDMLHGLQIPGGFRLAWLCI